MADIAIHRIAHHYLQRLAGLGTPIDRGIIFGSHARGTANAWSAICL